MPTNAERLKAVIELATDDDFSERDDAPIQVVRAGYALARPARDKIIVLTKKQARSLLAELQRKDAVVDAAAFALRRIESDIESDIHKTMEGGMLRAALAALQETNDAK